VVQLLYKVQPDGNADLILKDHFCVDCDLRYAIRNCGTTNAALLDEVIKWNNQAMRNISKVDIKERIRQNDTHFFTNTRVTRNYRNSFIKCAVTNYREKSQKSINIYHSSQAR